MTAAIHHPRGHTHTHETDRGHLRHYRLGLGVDLDRHNRGRVAVIVIKRNEQALHRPLGHAVGVGVRRPRLGVRVVSSTASTERASSCLATVWGLIEIGLKSVQPPFCLAMIGLAFSRKINGPGSTEAPSLGTY